MIESEHFEKGILDIVEIHYLKIVAISAARNIITLWDLKHSKLLLKFDVNHSNMQNMIFVE
jgi:hypothetical protein